MENALNHFERQTIYWEKGLNNLREIIQLLRMKIEEEKKPAVMVGEEEDWNSEANSPPFYLPRQRTISFE